MPWACKLISSTFLVSEGYGRAMINAVRNKERLHAPQSEFPLILGRDFSGTILKTGMNVKRFKSGDKVSIGDI